MIGVIVAVIINWFPPLNKFGDHYDKQRRMAYINSKVIKERINEIEKERDEAKEENRNED